MTSSSVAEQLAARCAARLESSAGHRLFGELTAGSTPEPVWRTYLALETDFVRWVAETYEWCLAAVEPAGEAASFFAAAMVDLRAVQLPLLERLGGLGLPSRRAEPLRRHITAARNEGGVPAILACMCAAETLYETWCTRAVAADVSRPAVQQEWIGLHAAPAFRRGRVRLGRALEECAGSERLDGWFVGMLDAEDSFHTLAFEEAA